MADSKISALPASTTPLAGTEVLPIVQSGTTKQVTVANLTAGRAVATGALTVTGDATLSTGNLIQGTAAKGINFTANTPTAGMTTQLLNNYEEGTWTPVPSKASTGAITGSIVSYGKYIRVGNLVTLFCDISINSISAQGSGLTSISGIPFTAARSYIGVGALGYNSAFLTVVMASCYVHSNGNIYFHESLNTDSNSTADWKAVGYLSLTVSYYV